MVVIKWQPKVAVVAVNAVVITVILTIEYLTVWSQNRKTYRCVKTRDQRCQFASCWCLTTLHDRKKQTQYPTTCFTNMKPKMMHAYFQHQSTVADSYRQRTKSCRTSSVMSNSGLTVRSCRRTGKSRMTAVTLCRIVARWMNWPIIWARTQRWSAISSQWTAVAKEPASEQFVNDTLLQNYSKSYVDKYTIKRWVTDQSINRSIN